MKIKKVCFVPGAGIEPALRQLAEQDFEMPTRIVLNGSTNFCVGLVLLE